MKDRIMMAAAALCSVTSAAVHASGVAEAPAPVAIPDRLAVSDVMSWTFPDDHTAYVENAQGQWYRVDLSGPCASLANAYAIAIATPRGRGTGTASALVTGGGRCAIRAIVPVSRPALPPDWPDAAFGGAMAH